MYGLGGDMSQFSGGMNGLPSDMSMSLGNAPMGIYSGLDPSASAGAYGGNPLGGGMAGQAAGAPSSGGMNQLMQMMLIQQAMNSASHIGQKAPLQENNFQQYAQPQSGLTPQMMGSMMMGGR